MTARQILEGGVFGTLALALHLVLFAAAPEEQAGISSSGAGGTDVASLQAASASVAEQVTQYDRIPEPAPKVDAPAAPPQVQMPQMDAPDLPRLAEAAPEAPPTPAQPAAPTATAEAPPPSPEAPPPPPEPTPPPKPRPKPEPPPKAKPKPAAKVHRAQDHDSAAERAAGAGGGASAGDRSNARVSTLSAGQERSLRAQWGAAIRARIERAKRYPSAAGWASGSATVQLSIARNGQLAGVRLIRSSGNPALDQAAVEAVQRAGHFPNAPDGLTDRAYAFSLTIRFSR
ncbi:energy transducer TonB [Acidimangrovimonas sediminis]|uniref:energy transducer TonB n=1 Tax=Acidimangrovimonas sediminis TaxID=2056283 RepID=UPI000C80E290|nr:TonB family protein [Acidimangrovimonas sediminis]